jgi:plastocyanin
LRYCSGAARRPPLLAALGLAISAGLAAAASPVVIVQVNRAFSVADVRIHRGDSLRFLNQDDFDHQIFVESPAFNFESDEASPGSEVDVRFTESGTFVVHCHIHPKMHLSVAVE